MKKKAETTADVAHDILTEYDAKNHDIDENALNERAQAMFNLIEKWTNPGDFLVITARFKEVKKILRAAFARGTNDDYVTLLGEMVAAVLGIYALAEARLIVHTNQEFKKHGDKVE